MVNLTDLAPFYFLVTKDMVGVFFCDLLVCCASHQNVSDGLVLNGGFSQVLVISKCNKC